MAVQEKDLCPLGQTILHRAPHRQDLPRRRLQTLQPIPANLL